MPYENEYYHSILIVSAREQFDQIVKKSLSGFVTVDIRKNVTQARRCILERYYDLVVINAPLGDESGEEFAIDVTEKCNASVLLVTPQDVFEDALDRVTDVGILVLPKPSPKGHIDKAVRFLAAVQNKIHEQERKTKAAQEKLEEQRIVNRAKFLLIEKTHMTEDDAHRFIGKQAMNNGVSRGKAARMILDEME